MSNPPEQLASPPAATQSPPLSPVLVLGVGILAISFSAILVRMAQAGAPSLVIATGRTLLATLFFLPPAVAWRRDELAQLKPAGWRWAVLAGVMLGLHLGSWIASLGYTSVTSSTVLFSTAPFWVALASPLVLGERVSRPVKIGMVLALAGSAIIALEGWQGDDQSLVGDGLALGSAVTYAAYFLIGRHLRATLSLISYNTLVYGTAAVLLLLITWASGHSLFGYSPQTYLLIVLMAVFPQLLGHSAYNYALKYLPAVYVSVASISEPVGATILALLLLQELPGWLTLAGSVFILAGLYIASRKR